MVLVVGVMFFDGATLRVADVGPVGVGEFVGPSEVRAAPTVVYEGPDPSLLFLFSW